MDNYLINQLWDKLMNLLHCCVTGNWIQQKYEIGPSKISTVLQLWKFTDYCLEELFQWIFFADGNVIRMIVMGDWGGLPFWPYFSPFEKATASQIMKVAVAEQSDFLLALGDNFYYDGVTDEYDARFQVGGKVHALQVYKICYMPFSTFRSVTTL